MREKGSILAVLILIMITSALAVVTAGRLGLFNGASSTVNLPVKLDSTTQPLPAPLDNFPIRLISNQVSGNVNKAKEVKPPELECVSSQVAGQWSQNYLITYNDYSLAYTNYKLNPTKFCIWDKDGRLLYRLEANIPWTGAGNREDPDAQFGLLPRSPEIFFVYSAGINAKDVTDCQLFLIDLKNPQRTETIFPPQVITKQGSERCLERNLDAAIDLSRVELGETANWKIYQGESSYTTDGSSSFIIKYPSDWVLDGRILYPMGKHDLRIDPRIILGSWPKDTPGQPEQRKYPAGIASYYWDSKGKPVDENTNAVLAFAVFNIGKYSYIFDVENIPEGQSAYYEVIFNKMLSTFRLTPK